MRITKPFDSKHLEELASQSAQVPTEPDEPRSEALLAGSASTRRNDKSDPRPTGKLHKDEIRGLLNMSEHLAQASPPAPAPADPRPAHARLVPAGSTNALPATIDDNNDRSTQRMQAKHLQAVAESGMEITPALLESVDWYGETDAAAAQAKARPRAPENVLDELGRELDRELLVGGGADPAAHAPAPRGSAPQLARSPQKPSTPSKQHAAGSPPRPRRSGEPARDAASPAMDRIAGPQRPQAPSSAGLRIAISLIGLILLAVVAFVGFSIAT